MPDFSNPGDRVANRARGDPGITMSVAGSMRDTEHASDGLRGRHDAHRREQHTSHPCASAGRTHEHYQPAYCWGAARDAWDRVRGR